MEALTVNGARVNNLKNIDVTIPHGALTVITGLSGSGKSSLAFDTIYKEGQRRYIDTFGSYARNMLGSMERPDVDRIDGLSPVIAIEQKTVNRNPRSTIGTTTEIYDFLRLLYARIGEARSYISGKPMVKYTDRKIVDVILEKFDGRKVYLLAPLVRNRKGHYKELFEQLRKKGFINVRVDGELREIELNMKLDRYKNHTVELVVDRLKVSSTDRERLNDTVVDTLRQGEDTMLVLDVDTGEVHHFSKRMMDPDTGLSYAEPAPHNFSFNSPQGACRACKGLGYVNIVDREKIMPDMTQSIHSGGIVPLGKYRNSLLFWQIEAICKLHGATLKTPLKDLPEECINEILNGTTEHLAISNETMATSHYFNTYEGVVKYVEMQQDEEAGSGARNWSGQFFSRAVCSECGGARLNREALHYFIDGKNIADLCRMDINELHKWSCEVEERLTPQQRLIGAEIFKEIRSRLSFLVDVGLDYLQLDRNSSTLSGGESQRIRLATQIGSELVNVLYILDEPSIGLHQRDNRKLISSLQRLRDADNSVIVVEHDKDMMLDADYIVDIGPEAGRHGGEVVYQGTPKDMLKSGTLTADYLTGKRAIEVPSTRRPGNGQTIELHGASGHNLKDVDLTLPLGTLTCVAGVSGSGKSTLINATLQPILSQRLYRSSTRPLPYASIDGVENIDKVVTVDQSPLGKSPRSNPATYTGVFADIRNLFVALPEAKMRGYKPGRFSFNVSGGRCDSCNGNGYRTIEMHFLPDVLVPCEACGGRRYNRETLEVRLKGKSIADVLDMTINQAVEFFANQPTILNKIKVLQDIGLGYIKLGQPSSTLSGGENQRVKLATELAKRDTGRTLFILDEPTTGLHFEDIKTLMGVLNRLVDKGNTVLVIEHNLDVLKCADHIIDMGPGGGASGGRIMATGTPEEVAATDSPTAPFLREELGLVK
ncbi:MAG: excinuclease ABC subunit UvrA [Candidatus Amulumruptor caecigallinarius]|nr:excinuclease ABC subunit UvrA [Candidatus Amulumruptor caecigallinarius]MCM1396816.1 excinuclease ABC subunit UvrA [Candidatus Amulumruptor caecigallinarius]MCM1454240.1 excinuclease ABC subunit UvrA [bacterium]